MGDGEGHISSIRVFRPGGGSSHWEEVPEGVLVGDEMGMMSSDTSIICAWGGDHIPGYEPARF